MIKIDAELDINIYKTTENDYHQFKFLIILQYIIVLKK